ncbi:DUF805 domain-containing protein [Stappia sp.]|jgi:uncharacterized membrane protein YhaH (DUF805 family)|uniref:DUF805 domain-containing protein n=1 Tax=Stappia sp. TaxID=1870903 RepID=UPI003D0DE562
MTAPVPHPGPLGPLWLLFSPIGRVSREPYWLALALTWALFMIPVAVWARTVEVVEGRDMASYLGDFINANPLMPFMLIAFQWVELALVIKRLQDRGLSGLLAILVFMPYLNILFVIGLGFMPGTPGPNAYGPWANGRWARPK